MMYYEHRKLQPPSFFIDGSLFGGSFSLREKGIYTIRIIESFGPDKNRP